MFILRKSQPDVPHNSHSLFEDLVRRHQGSIYRVAYRLTGNHEDTEDLVQEALLDAYAAFDRFRAGTYFDRWLFRILRNTYIDGTRARPKFVLQSLDATLQSPEGGRVSQEIVDWSQHPERRMLEATLEEPLQEALLSLSE